MPQVQKDYPWEDGLQWWVGMASSVLSKPKGTKKEQNKE